ncbi:MAG: hypothetical protein U0T77_10735 [Chitinophagales bacterium]
MGQPTVVNKFGKVTGWNSINVHLLGRDLEGITELSYDDKEDIEGVKGAGKFDVGFGGGNYTAKASITLLEEERRALLDSLPSGTRLQEIPPFPIVVEYEYKNKIYKDVIQQCVIMNNGVEVKQGDKSIAYKFDLYTPVIDWNVNNV